jgi:cob(I)alamin adenosyltransferase
MSRNEDIGEGAVIYLNRLSDFLFVLARYVNQKADVQETKWKP